MQSLDRGSQLLQNGITNTMFAKAHGIIVLDLSGNQDISIARTGGVRLDSIFAQELAESIALMSFNQFKLTKFEVLTIPLSSLIVVHQL